MFKVFKKEIEVAGKKIIFTKDNSFEYAEKIENLIKQTNKQEKIYNDKKSKRISNA